MNDTLLESANLYVLGLLTAPEQAAFEQELRGNAALQQEVHALQGRSWLSPRAPRR